MAVEFKKPKGDDEGLEGCAVMLLVLPALLWSGFVLSKAWLWFVVPLGLPAISGIHAGGLIIVLRLGSLMSRSESKTSLAGTVVHAVVGPALALLMAWCLKLML